VSEYLRNLILKVLRRRALSHLRLREIKEGMRDEGG
jgi:hypothetical protein